MYSLKRAKSLTSEGFTVTGFGASGRGNMIVNQFNFQSCIKEVYDESPERIGRELGFSGIPVLDFKRLKADDYDFCFIFSWNHLEQIVAKWPHVGKTLIVPLSEYKEIKTV